MKLDKFNLFLAAQHRFNQIRVVQTETYYLELPPIQIDKAVLNAAAAA